MHLQGFPQPQFTGHETFPMRYGWLKKVYDAVRETETHEENKSVFRDEKATARFGVGKNMVASMRHWGKSTDVIEERRNEKLIRTTEFGRMLFGFEGYDPFLEKTATMWLLHWKLAGRSLKTTWYWSFNVFAGATFERETLVKGLQKLSNNQGWKRVSKNTIKRDVDCFIRTYVARNFMEESSYEDVIESPLTELGLMRSISRREGYQFIRGPKRTLSNWILAYVLADFWNAFQRSNTLSFDSVLYAPGSPGRVFLLDENSLAEKLENIDDVTDSEIRWSETAGMRQLLRDGIFTDEFKANLLRKEYKQLTPE